MIIKDTDAFLYERYEHRNNFQYNDILLNALDEFYENGCKKKASFDRIAKRCNISRASLYYHFETKDKLASSVYFFIGDRIHRKLSQKMMRYSGNYNFQIATVLERYIQLEMFRRDEKAARFYKEYFDSNFQDIYADLTLSFPFYEMYNDIYQLNLSHDEIKILGTLVEASMAAFMLLYFSNGLSLSYEEVSKRILSIPFEQMKSQCKNLVLDENKIIEESLEYYNKLDINILPYFDIE